MTTLFAAVVLLVSVIVVAPPANAVTANVTIVANAAKDGTHTLNYESTVTKAGTVKYIDVSLPSGTGGSVTSLNGKVRTVSTGVLRWTPSTTIKVTVGARFKIPFYGLKLPTTGEPWSLWFKAVSTTGATLSYGTGRTATGTVTASNPIPGQKTNLTYRTKVTRAGTLSKIQLYIPPGSSCKVSTVNGTLTGSGAYLTWTPTSPISVSIGTQLNIPVNNLCLSVYGGNNILPIVALTSGGTVLAKASGLLPLIAPPADMPDVPVTPIAAPPPPCPNSWPSVTDENAQAGTAAWAISAGATSTTMSAYLTRTSATCGDTVDIKVDNDSLKKVSVIAYRMGYYGGNGAREIWRQDNVSTVNQPAATIGGTDSQGRNLYMVSAANWSKTLTIPIDETFVPGTYLIKVSDGTYATYAPLTVRDDTGTKHDILLQQATTTWSAYNDWGGRSFYSTTNKSGRLSYNRPYSGGQGSGQFLPLEQGMVFWLEKQGADVTYWTDEDLDEFGGQVPARADNLMIPSHDEYYSMPMRAAVSQAIESGVNVASMGANTAYREIAYTSGSDRRTWDADHWTSPDATWRFRGDAYASQPLLGAEYVCPLPGGTMVTGSTWLFDGIAPGTSIPGFIAGEMDRLNPDLYQHPGIQSVYAGSADCRGARGIEPMTITAFEAPSGARVFNASVFSFSCYLNGRCSSDWTVPAPSLTSQGLVQTMMKNVLGWIDPTISLATETNSVTTMKAKVPKMKVPVNPPGLGQDDQPTP
ncbi:N,N-dimethylformamidase beta subunit family domain-containing protein [Aeromicrobium sp.]|uniref:N,N-dimethylformamidase beta subunit family domain-containing protein n=1 Tax=Aeromicrobium sp. TaxID=1871063 RepID=UPI002FC949FF